MGKIKGGLNGTASGKVGNLSYYQTKEMQLVRSKPAKPYKFSKGQKANHTGFGIRQGWLSPISEFLKVGCRNNLPYVGGPALAMKYLSANAVSGTGADQQVHPERMLVSMGDLPSAGSAAVLAEGRAAVFSWDPEITFPASPFDQPLLLAYNVENKKATFSIKGNFRKDSQASLPIEEPGRYHCYLGFRAEDHSRQSDSLYLGTLEIL